MKEKVKSSFPPTSDVLQNPQILRLYLSDDQILDSAAIGYFFTCRVFSHLLDFSNSLRKEEEV